MQFSQTRITINGTSEEVARLLDLDPRLRESLVIDVPPVESPALQTATRPSWTEFSTNLTGTPRQLVEVLIENKGTVSDHKVTARLGMTRGQLSGPHGMLNRTAARVMHEARFITTKKKGKTLYYSIRPEVLSQLVGSMERLPSAKR